ncbi:hypothetical protein K7472_09845 [Streptomyces sp. PTM05]|uniref:Uncharacterized protein n=1 Tax=Streptantibioticus parmotrematis TaxID=2873249 RepID=A0ABS7QPN9_9ACTN|nr:hypothetical protein [Streptantibioticus parmotrematis]MBY8885144.1 hypothetical protein [Streptantibioticus parmotrematis]
MTGYRARYGGSGAARLVAGVADAAALILIVWIVMWFLDANRANDLVNWVHNAADWLSGWSRDLFTPRAGWLRTVLNYGIAAAVYLAVGHFVADRIRRV